MSPKEDLETRELERGRDLFLGGDFFAGLQKSWKDQIMTTLTKITMVKGR